jgi:hypothetical protein
MALIWAWNPDIPGECNCESSSNAGWAPMYQQGWRWGSSSGNDTETDVINHARHPQVGYGGSDHALRVQAGGWHYNYTYYSYLTSPANCWPAINDGIIQFHLYTNHTESDYPVLTLYGPGGEVFHLHQSGLKLLARYMKSGFGMTDGLVTTAEYALNTWVVVSIRFKTHATEGEIEISINGMPAESSGILAMGHALEWNQFRVWSTRGQWDYYRRFTHFTVYDDPTLDNALEIIKWTCVLRPSSDALDGSWEDPGGLTDDLFSEVNEETFSTANYCTTIASADEVRWGVDTDDIDLAWAPSTIDGVVVSAAMRGDGSLYSGQAVLSAARSLTGTAAMTASGTTVTGTGTDFSPEVQVGDFVKLDADGEEAWTQVDTVDSDGQLTLVTGGYLGSTGSGTISAQAMGALTATTLLTKYVDPVVRPTVPGTANPWTTVTIDAAELGAKVREIT